MLVMTLHRSCNTNNSYDHLFSDMDLGSVVRRTTWLLFFRDLQGLELGCDLGNLPKVGAKELRALDKVASV
jgi:hypothetical protein